MVSQVAYGSGIAVVLSAMKGVTDLLISAAREAEDGADGFKTILENIREKHFDAVRYLFPAPTRPRR